MVASSSGGEDSSSASKGIFNFVTDNESSRNSIQLETSQSEDGNTGQMISQIEFKGRDFGRYVESGGFLHWVRETPAQGLGLDKSETPKVLFLHGAPTQSWSYRVVMTQLSDKGFHCFAPDWIGFGFSDKPQPGYGCNYTEEEYHQQLDGLLESLGLSQTPLRLVVQGFILGSYGLTWALKNPTRVSHLAILNTPLTPRAPLPGVFTQLRFPLVGEFVSQNAVVPERFVEGGSPYVLELDDADVYRLPYLDTSEAGFALLEAVRKAPLKDLSKRISEGFAAGRWTVPTVVGWGEKDKYLPQSEATEFAATNPSAITARILDGAGHLPQEDWPEKVVDTLNAHFKRRQS